MKLFSIQRIATFIFLVLVLTACAPVQGFAQGVVELPIQLQSLLAAVSLAFVVALLSGSVPGEYIDEIATAITTAVITIIGVILKMIPAEFEPIAIAVLGLIVVILGIFKVVSFLRRGSKALIARYSK